MISSAGILPRFRARVARNARDARGPSEWTTAANGKNDKSSCRTPRLTSPRARFLLVCALTIAAVLLDAALSRDTRAGATTTTASFADVAGDVVRVRDVLDQNQTMTISSPSRDYGGVDERGIGPYHGLTTAQHFRRRLQSVNTWGQLGSDIESTYTDGFGMSVSMSHDGTRMAVGVPNSNLYSSNADLYSEGSVLMFELSSGTWTQLGNTLSSAVNYENFGSSVSMSGDGTRVVIGAPQYDPAPSGVTSSHGGSANQYDGRVRVYEYAAGA
jgi:hypothetical protein